MITLISLIITLICISYSNALCGYETCPETKGEFVNLHIVPHSHDDVGWLKTVDQYYYGGRNNIQNVGVQYILDSVVQELINDPQKKFIYVETAFFWKWWQEQTLDIKQHVKRLVNNGQLEFIGGAWSMNDEAATHYHSIIDQFTWGLRMLHDEFGVCGRPKIGWQIDPFGHSRENAAIMARIGFDGLFLGRIDWQDKNYRMENQTMEMIWRTSQNDDSEVTQLFTGVLYNTYSAPKGFCFDINCKDEPIIDNINSPEYNVNDRVEDFLSYMREYIRAYATNNVLVTMGEDFNYVDAHVYYKNLDKLIKYINRKKGVDSPFNAFYSTPSCYLKSVNKRQIKLPEKRDDFMPYSSDQNSFWTGYYTSRPTLKRYERLGNNYLQVCKQLSAISNTNNYDAILNLNSLREAMGVMQHHDAVTGTEKQEVAYDYARILTNAIHKCDDVTSHSLKKLMGTELNIKSCLLLNESSCDVSENENSFVVTLYNPLSRFVDRLVQLPIRHVNKKYSIKCPRGEELESQIIPISNELLAIPGRNSRAIAKLSFIARRIPPMGYKTFYISVKNGPATQNTNVIRFGLNPVIVGYNNGIKLILTAKGHSSGVLINGKEYPLSQEFKYYVGAIGNNVVPTNRSSGAYIFRPNGTAVHLGAKRCKVYTGPVLTEIHCYHTDWVSQVMRIYQGSKAVEFQWLVGPIPVRDGKGKEIVSVFHSNSIHNNGKFFTDSNGRESIERLLNQRQSWPLELKEPIAGNYYPVTTKINIENEKEKMSVITDRAQGGSSLNDGEIELMVHRRLLHDDGFGVGEALNETAFGEGLIAMGSHFVTFENNGYSRLLMQEKVLDSWIFFSPAKSKSFQVSIYKTEYTSLTAALPDNVQVLTLEPWDNSTYLLRLEHIMEKSDDPVLSQPAFVNIKEMFTCFEVVEINEMMLGANMEVNESSRLKWKSNNNSEAPKLSQVTDRGVKLEPMEIRTFIIKIKK